VAGAVALGEDEAQRAAGNGIGDAVTITATGDSVAVVMAMAPLHDGTWTQRLVAGRANELDNLAKVLAE
jgi:hypothetical protein